MKNKQVFDLKDFFKIQFLFITGGKNVKLNVRRSKVKKRNIFCIEFSADW